ncbi:uncharacterized protein TNCV_4084761 [Trichonephila clavipes]|nr:uncharacterized protein TNCV_4084761 [Trichonephila clavipes]
MQWPVCYRDLKTSTQNYIHRVWQENWDQQILNKLHSIHLSTSHWAALTVRRHDVRLTRLHIGHTHFTHRHLLSGEHAPECPSCKVNIGVWSPHLYACASKSNLDNLKRVQMSADRNISRFNQAIQMTLCSLRVTCSHYCLEDLIVSQNIITSFPVSVISLEPMRIYATRLTTNASTWDQTSLDILNFLSRISSNHRVHFQWVPFHEGIDGYDKADFLAGTAAEEKVSPTGFSELSSL